MLIFPALRKGGFTPPPFPLSFYPIYRSNGFYLSLHVNSINKPSHADNPSHAKCSGIPRAPCSGRLAEQLRGTRVKLKARVE